MLDYKFGNRLPVHNHGYVALLEVMGSDEAIVNAARISYNRRGESEDRALIRYLLRHRHTTPFEMGVMKFEVKMPIFVARQWVRHRTASINEMSARYTELPNEMFVPESVALQSTMNNQGREDGGITPEESSWYTDRIKIANDHSYSEYESLLVKGVSLHLHGYVKLLEVMGSDEVIVDAARISYDRRGKSADRILIRYLLRHRHTTPFEMGVLRFEVKMPIFVARQWIRHRTASINEMSARYTELPNEMFVPESVALQSTMNNQGREDGGITPEESSWYTDRIKIANDHSYSEYESLLVKGVSREIARGVLPVNIYTKFVWKMDLHNLMHFLDLRLDPHAQKEIRDYAEVIEKLVALHFPISYEAFVDYIKEVYICSRMEIDLLQKLLHFYMYEREAIEPDQAQELLEKIDAKAGANMSKRELAEFRKKFLDG